MSLKNPVTPPGIDPGTVRLVSQRLNHYATPGPLHVINCLVFIAVVESVYSAVRTDYLYKADYVPFLKVEVTGSQELTAESESKPAETRENKTRKRGYFENYDFLSFL